MPQMSPLFTALNSIDFLDTDRLTPRKAMQALCEGVARLRKARKLPKQEDAAANSKLLDKYGVVAVGGWAKGNINDRDQRLLIHWPSVLGDLDGLILRDFPEIVRLVWCFNQLIRFRSHTWYQLLQRKLAWNHAVVRSSTHRVNFDYLFGLMPEEDVALNAMNHNLSGDDALLDAFIKSFDSTFAGGGRTGTRSKSVWARKLGLYSDTISILYMRELPRSLNFLDDEFTLVRTPGVKVFPLTATGATAELMYAMHHRVKDHGVVLFPKPAGEDSSCLAINLRLYSEYRAPFSRYYELNRPKNYPREDPLVYVHYCSKFRNACPGVIYDGGPPLFRDQVLKVWPREKIDNIFFVSWQKAVEHFKVLAQLSHARLKTTPTRSRIRQSRVKGSPNVLTVRTPALPEKGYERLTFKLIRRGNTTFFHPPWDVDYDKVEAGRIPGVTVIASLGMAFFSFGYLDKQKDTLLNDSRILRDWVKLISEYTAEEYRVFRKQQRRDVVQPELRDGRENLGGIRFTRAEREAIILLMRPNMPDEAKDTLMKTCYGRDWKSIRQYAKKLRRELIALGEIDINKLPHLNYNAALRKQLQTRKEELGK